VGETCGFRVELEGVSIAYIPDHQQPLDGSFGVSDEALELAEGVDLLIHDAQYLPHEFERKSYWGHCTIEYALHVAKEAGAKRLALFHHDPEHTDQIVDQIVVDSRASDYANHLDEIIAAREGLTVNFE
jgi:ribonuclease BN (tRNA processing enzyme)